MRWCRGSSCTPSARCWRVRHPRGRARRRHARNRTWRDRTRGRGAAPTRISAKQIWRGISAAPPRSTRSPMTPISCLPCRLTSVLGGIPVLEESLAWGNRHGRAHRLCQRIKQRATGGSVPDRGLHRNRAVDHADGSGVCRLWAPPYRRAPPAPGRSGTTDPAGAVLGLDRIVAGDQRARRLKVFLMPRDHKAILLRPKPVSQVLPILWIGGPGRPLPG